MGLKLLFSCQKSSLLMKINCDMKFWQIFRKKKEENRLNIRSKIKSSFLLSSLNFLIFEVLNSITPMEIYTKLLIILAFIVALGLSWLQYFYRSKSRLKVNKLLCLLRFLALFGVLILLINPKITRKQHQIIKTPLVVAIDNSRSIKVLQQEEIALSIKEKIQSSSGLKEKFDIQVFGFDSESRLSDEFDFNGNQTRIDKLAKNTASIYQNRTFPTLLLSDGNQTLGSDYLYAFANKNSVYPIVLGDTLVHLDLKINQLNANRYAFYQNKFPVEVFLGYEGQKNIEADFVIREGNGVLFREKITFNKNKKSHTINALLDASKVGVQIYQAVISSSENEKNTYNNTKNFAVEIIDQRTEVALISDITHPDLGALKRAIESNEQNKVSVLNSQKITSLADFDVVILYQPTPSFQSVFREIKNSNKNYFLITGKHTDFNFVNPQQDVFKYRPSMQKEDYLGAYQSGFSSFAQEDIGFEDFPPLENLYGNLEIKQNISTLLEAKIRNINTEKPLLFFCENGSQRTATLLGEGIWKWRLHHYSKAEDFESFDIFINKITQYLATNNKRKSLVVNHENFYNSGESIEISAQYFNKNYEFEENARLSISVKNVTTNQTKSYDLLKSHNYYKVNLDGLAPGKYSFTVKELSTNTGYTASFEVIDFDIEKQYTNANYQKLQLLAQNTNGKLFFENQTDQLIEELLHNENFKSIQKELTKKLPLIDFWTLLGLIVALLGLEWFIRKYNGML